MYIKMYEELYYKEFILVVMEPDKSKDGHWASWRPRRVMV
jgi:hypothetical protein